MVSNVRGFSHMQVPVTGAARQKPKSAHVPPINTDTTPVAKAVSAQVTRQTPSASVFAAHSKVQYDKLDNQHRRALSAYDDVMKHQQREALSEMFGVDVYV